MMLPIDTKDLILIHLESFEEFKNEEEVPYKITPKGITEAVEMSEGKPYTKINELEENGFIVEKKRCISGQDRKRNVYFLTEKGFEREDKIWNKIKDEKITLKDEDEEREIRLKKSKNFVEGRNPVVKVLSNIDDDGLVDTEEIGASDVFVGRDVPLKKLRDNLKKAKNEGSFSVFVEGEAGIGKTTLIHHLKPFAKELGYRFLSGTCQSEISDPYLPFKEAFSSYIEPDDESSRGGSMAFLGTSGGQKVKDKNMFDSQKKATFYETTKYVRELANQNPLLVFLDDLQWVDKATLDIFTYMNEKLEDAPVFFVCTYRPEDITDGHPLPETIHRLRRAKKLEEIELDPLDMDNTKDIIEGLIGTSEIPEYFVENLHKKTEGNPLFVKESIQQMLEEGIIDPKNDRFPKKEDDILISDLIQNVIERRINRLDDDTIKILEIGSVIGEKINFELLTETSKMDEIDLLDHIDMLIGNQLWVEGSDQEVFFFSHELIEDTAYNRIKGLKKRLLHKRVAKNMVELFGDQLDEKSPKLAYHYEKAEQYSEALDYYIKAGERAEGLYAHEDAIEMYKKALEMSENISEDKVDQIEILQKIAKAHSILGNYDKDRKYLNEALEKIDDDEKPTILRKICDSYYEQGKYEKSLEFIEEGLSKCDDINKEKAKLLSIKGWTYTQRGDYDQALQIFNKEKKVADELNQDEEMGQVYHDLGTVALQKGELDEGIDKLKNAIEIRERSEERQELSKSLNNIGIAYFNKGNLEKAEENYQKSLDILDEIGDKHGYSTTLNNLAGIYSKKGDIEKSIEAYEESLETSRMVNDKHGEAISLGNVAGLYMEIGDLEKASEYLEDAIELKKEIDDKHGLSVDLTNKATIYIKKGDIEKSEEIHRESLEISEKIGNRRGSSISYSNLCDLYTLKGEYDEAEEYINRAKELAEDIGSKDTLCYALDELGKIKRLEENSDEAIEAHEKGIEIGKNIMDKEVTALNQVGLAEDYHAKEEYEKSREIAEEVFDELKDVNYPNILVRCNLILGKSYRDLDIVDESEIYLNKAIDKSRQIGDIVWEAKSLFEMGLLKKKEEEKDESLKYFEESLDLFKKTSVERWIKKIESNIDEIS
ncbi:MAG: tetratricopeptide repeat protein [Thermoplasmatota archaeon]